MIQCYTFSSEMNRDVDTSYLVDSESGNFESFYPTIVIIYNMINRELTLLYLHSRYESIHDNTNFIII